MLPTQPKPIVIIGAGGIVNDAHMPAYTKAGFDVIGIFDINHDNAKTMIDKWNIKTVFESLDQATSHGTNVVYDCALPPSAIADTLHHLPHEATVLIQKPMGENFQQALDIYTLCREKKLISAINFQLRFSPQMMAVKHLIDNGKLGELLDIEMTVNINTPWHLFLFLKGLERVEIAVHSIHYLDLIRSFVGEPNGVFSRTMRDARTPHLAQTKTSIILDYGHSLRCTLSINHNHDYENKFQMGQLRIEGTKGGIVAQLGAIMNYPNGMTDELWFAKHGDDWQAIPLQGTWFPDAFIGTMSNIQCYANGEADTLFTSTEDAIKTMALVEACFTANKTPGTPLPSI